MPIEWAYRVALGHNGNTDWVLTGQGEIHRDSNTSNGNKGIHGKSITADNLHIDIHHGDVVADPGTQYRGAADRRRPTTDQMCSILRSVLDCYDRIRPNSLTKSRDIPLIFRRFIENYDNVSDETEITEYIKEWF